MPTALIVEDEPDANHLLCALVKLQGYHATSAATGSEAIDLARNVDPDVVFLDLMLPDLDGYSVCRCLESDPRTALAPVVIITARLAQNCESDSYEAGASFFVRKPYFPETINQTLRDAAAWRESVLQLPAHGDIPLDHRQKLPALREFTRLTRLLRAHTDLADDDLESVLSRLRELAEAAFQRGADQPSLDGPVATLSYRLAPDHLSCSLVDQSGWLADEPDALRPGLFDAVASPDPSRLNFTFSFRPLLASPTPGDPPTA